MINKSTQKIISKVTRDYNKIASDFSNKRDYLSPDILELGNYAQEGDKVLDLGCGNGRLFDMFTGKKIKYTGADISAGLVELAKKRFPDQKFVSLDSDRLPFPDQSFDLVYCLAVLHHLPGQKAQRQFLSEAARALKPKGKIILTVWYLYPRVSVWKKLRDCFVANAIYQERLKYNDIYFSYKDGNRRLVVNRFIHLFRPNELNRLFLASGFCLIKEAAIRSRGQKKQNQNIIIVGQKN